MKEQIKAMVEKVTGLGRPILTEITVRQRKPSTYKFKDDGETPNNSKCPLIVYRSPVVLHRKFDPAAIFEVLFQANKWGDGWRATMYDYNHFHSSTHECLGIARGTLIAKFGGSEGREIELKAGDVVIIPAGVGHRRIKQSRRLLIVGVYPANSRKYDEPKPGEIDHATALKKVSQVKNPLTDPVFGKSGPLLTVWLN
jgi:uncharacterized protein YjlB